MSAPAAIKEVLSKSGILFEQTNLAPALCKPKILPLKSFTQEKLEKMQKDAQNKMKELQEQLLKDKVRRTELSGMKILILATGKARRCRIVGRIAIGRLSIIGVVDGRVEGG